MRETERETDRQTERVCVRKKESVREKERECVCVCVRAWSRDCTYIYIYTYIQQVHLSAYLRSHNDFIFEILGLKAILMIQ